MPLALIWPLVKANWKVIGIVLAVLALLTWHKIQVNQAWRDGRAALKAEQAAEAKRRNDDANAADADARRCASDPACLLQDDGNRRD
jgi:hypothetical protein